MSRPRVLLLWPGSDGAAAGNFGVPQLVGLGTYLEAETRAEVTLVDLSCERAFGKVDLPKLFEGADGKGYDVVGFSCYSSFDYLPLCALAELARVRLPNAVLVAGGYHVSARPDDFVFDGSLFDVAVVGEGERPLAKVVRSAAGGAPLRGVVLGPDPILSLDELPESNWSLLSRYQPIARRVASQVEVYLSRGCPFDCAFCMEKAKREVSWRGFSVDRAIQELRNLHAFLNPGGGPGGDWTVYFADALFGMPKAWRRAFLQRLASEGFPVLKHWLLIRVDMVDEEDMRLFADANCAPGFGLESGDPDMLATIRKAGRLHDYLDRMLEISEVSRRFGVPWGANVIVGHPGETEETLRRSAAYMRKLFLEPESTMGFLSVDPYRFYPGSPIDDERQEYAARFGTRIHRPEWWKDGDQAFLSEWVDPSRELSYRRRDELMTEEFAPILRELPARFALQGPARPYFLRALEGQVEQFSDSVRLAYADRYYAWQKYTGQSRAAQRELEGDTATAALCQRERERSLSDVASRATVSSDLRAALVETPRELHAPLDALRASTRDVAIALDGSGAATVSAMHAYARTYELAQIRAGARVLDLGAGTGYGTALLARLVGPTGLVRGVELDPALVARGAPLLRAFAHASLIAGDAFLEASWQDGRGRVQWDAVVVGFAVAEIPPEFFAWMGDATLVIPRGPRGAQRLVVARRVRARGQGLEGEAAPIRIEEHDRVEYVLARREVPEPAPARSEADGQADAEASHVAPAPGKVRLPVVRAPRP